MTRYRVRFTREAQVEHAHVDKRRGGFWLEVIPKGTILEVNEASFRFWRARGAVEIVEKLSDVNPFQLPPMSAPVPPAELPRITKAEIRRQVTAAVAATGEELRACLEFLMLDEVLELLPDINADNVVVLRAALDDLRAGAGPHVHPDEFAEALADVELQTKPPSVRARLK